MHLPLNQIRAIAQDHHAEVVAFTQQLVQIPSMSGQEDDVAAAVTQKMNHLGYDEIFTDQVGNVIGKITGGNGPTILLNGHMDHVDAGPPENWPYPPFSGQIVNGELWGRASVDMKGPVACMLYAASFFKHLDLSPPGDIYMTVPVMEEIGGLGTQHLTTYLNAQAAICGEPSNNILRRGHRGRVEVMVKFTGRSAHASLPHLGENPHFSAAAFLRALPDMPLAHDDTLGGSTVVPTLYNTDQVSPNVIPGQVNLTLDWRNVPSESPEMIVAKVEALLGSSLPDNKATVAVTRKEFTTYTGVTQELPSIFPSFLLPKDSPFVQHAYATLVQAIGRDDGVDIWRFATDGGHLMTAGIPTIGFGPGDETLAHTSQERISLAQLKEAPVAYAALILALAQAAQE